MLGSKQEEDAASNARIMAALFGEGMAIDGEDDEYAEQNAVEKSQDVPSHQQLDLDVPRLSAAAMGNLVVAT